MELHPKEWPKHTAEWLSSFSSPPTMTERCSYILNSCPISLTAHVIVRNSSLAILTSSHCTHCSFTAHFPLGSGGSSFLFTTIRHSFVFLCVSPSPYFPVISFPCWFLKISLHILDRNPLLDIVISDFFLSQSVAYLCVPLITLFTQKKRNHLEV